MARIHSLKTLQKLPVTIDVAWDFFSRPTNLKEFTPGNLGFRIISKHHGDRMYAGQIIEYTITPLLGVPLYWMTEIKHVAERKYFVDEQRYGPYRLWHHQHHFVAVDGGVEMTDIVHYEMPYWFLGEIVHAVVVKRQLRKIFEYRFRKAEEVLGRWPGQECRLEFH